MKVSLIVTGSGPLIDLAVAGSLDELLLCGLPVIVPDMVRYEVIQEIPKPGAAQVAAWMRANDSPTLRLASTEVFEEFILLQSIKPAIKIRNRCEQAAAELLGRAIEDKDFGAILLFDDSVVRKLNFLTPLPDCVAAMSASEFLLDLKREGFMHNAESSLRRIVEIRGNEIMVAHEGATEGSHRFKNRPLRESNSVTR